MRRGVALFAFAVLGLSAGRASAMDLVVAAVRGAGYQLGQVVDSTKALSLKEGQEVTLIAPTGKTIKVAGPYDKPPDTGTVGDTTDVAAALRSLVAQNKASNDEVAVVRGAAPTTVVPPGPWLVDVTHVGNRCVQASQPVTLWRPGGGAAANLVITPYDRSWEAHAAWPGGADRIPLPNTVPLLDRSTYFVSLGGKENAINFIVIPATVSNDAMRVAWMMQQDCDGQAQALLKTVR